MHTTPFWNKKSLKIPKGVIRIRKSKKNRQHNDQKKNHRRTNNRSTKRIHKAKVRVARTPLKNRGELRCSGRINSSCSTSDTRRGNLVTNPVISNNLHQVWWS